MREGGGIFLIYLQSFFSSPRAEAFSVARWQPRGFSYPEIRCLAPFDADGRPIRGLPPERYLEAYAVALASRWPEVRRALEHFKRRDVSLLCWCNPKRQRGYPKLFCHTILIGFLAERFGLPVMYLDGRENPVWNEEDKHRFLRLVGFNLIEQKALTVFSDTVLSENPFLPFCGRNLAVKARKGGSTGGR